MLRICCHCQKETNEKNEAVGEAIPRSVLEERAEKELVTHGYCKPCFELIFGALDAPDGPPQKPAMHREAP